MHEAAYCKVIIRKGQQRPVVLPSIKAQDLTVGQGIDCSYTVDSANFPDKHFLLKRRGKVYFLLVPPGVTCEFASGNAHDRVTLQLLSRLQLIERRNGNYAVPFQPGTVALLHVGETVVGIEWSKPPVVGKTEDLPWDLRIAPLAKSEIIFLGFLLASFILSVSSVLMLKSYPFPRREPVDDRYAKLIIETPIVAPEMLKHAAPIEEKPPVEEVTPDTKGQSPAKRAGPANAAKAGGVQGKGLLAHLEKGGLGGVLESKELKNVFSGVGVLTTKRPAGQQVSGPRMGYRDSSGVDDLVAGISARSGGAGKGLGGLGKSTTAVSNPFDVSGSGSGHSLRSYQEIDRIIRKHLEAIRYVYERYLRTNPLFQGRVTLKFTINAEGYVTQSTVVSSNMDAPGFHDELMKRVKLWKFPAIEGKGGDVSVVYPFTFLPKRN